MKKLAFFLFSLLSFFTASISLGQYCIPVADCSYDDFINRFTFNTLSNINSGGSNCGMNSYIFHNQTTTVIKGNTYGMTMQSGPNWSESFGVWIDFNQNQNFNDPGEFVYSSPTSSTTLQSVNVTIPNTALSGNTRLRVRCNYGTNVTAGQACAPFTYGETEDYTITIQANNVPPISDFYAGSTTTCNGTIAFFDQSSGNPTSWSWNFGDGGNSTLQNPVHTYSTGGTYTVTLTTTNAFGTNTKTKTNYITYSPGTAPINASCTPSTTSNCCGFGITQFNFNTITSTTADGSAGYQDLTCSQTTVLKGRKYPIYVKAHVPAEHNIRAWIDYNNNGQFESTELVLSADQVLTVADTVTIPTNVVLNTGLRLRVSADYYVNPAPGPCTDPQVGQVEDYTVVVLNNTLKPDAEFSSDRNLSCSGSVQFQDESQNIPTAWSWDFGDGNTSTQQNPLHTYSTSGTYNVRLIASNSYGSDTIIKNNFIVTNIGGGPVAASCTPMTTSYCCNYGIYNVTLGTINNTSNGGGDGYKDYSCGMQVTLNKGSFYTLGVRTGSDNPEDVRAWIDYNNDGSFGSSEEILSSQNLYNHSDVFLVPNSSVLNTPLRMRVMSDFVGASLTPCSNVQWGQIEDYSVKIVDPNSISSYTETTVFTAFPNPAKENITIRFSNPVNKQGYLYLTDITGRRVNTITLPENLSETTLSLEEYSPGIYFITASFEGYSRTLKVIHE